jgi:tRNA C32,U32 (ribose-2'-O)-methylase TrmJ
MHEMKSDPAKAKANQEDMLAKMETKMDAIQAKADDKQEKMLARMREDIKSGQAEMRSTVCAILSELKTIQH